MTEHTEIQCPCCGDKIYIQPKLLLQGGGFSCSNRHCDASVSLSESSLGVANQAMNEFEKLKQIAQ